MDDQTTAPDDYTSAVEAWHAADPGPERDRLAEQVISDNRGMVIKLSQKWLKRGTGLDADELTAAGEVLIWDALRRFDLDNNPPKAWGRYLYQTVYFGLLKEVHRQERPDLTNDQWEARPAIKEAAKLLGSDDYEGIAEEVGVSVHVVERVLQPETSLDLTYEDGQNIYQAVGSTPGAGKAALEQIVADEEAEADRALLAEMLRSYQGPWIHPCAVLLRYRLDDVVLDHLLELGLDPAEELDLDLLDQTPDSPDSPLRTIQEVGRVMRMGTARSAGGRFLTGLERLRDAAEHTDPVQLDAEKLAGHDTPSDYEQLWLDIDESADAA